MTTIAHQLRGSIDRRGQNWEPTGHCFQTRIGEGIIERWQDKQVSTRIAALHVGTQTFKADRIGHGDLVGQPLIRCQTSFADDDESDVRDAAPAELAHGFDHTAQPFAMEA